MLITAKDMKSLDFHHFLLIFCHTLWLPVNLLFNLGSNLQQGNYQNYVKTWQADIRQAHDVLYRSNQQLSARSKGYYDRKASTETSQKGEPLESFVYTGKSKYM